MNAIALTGLAEIILPTRTIRWCDGGYFEHEGQIYRGVDAVFGTIDALETMTEGVGNTVPAVAMTIKPPDTTAPIDLSQPGNQTSPVRFIIAEYDVETGLILNAENRFVGQLDQTNLARGKGVFELRVSVVPLSERLFERNIGNTMSSVFHKSVHPDETGHDNATGFTVPVAWGTDKPVTGGTTGAGGARGGGGGGGGGGFDNMLRAY